MTFFLCDSYRHDLFRRKNEKRKYTDELSNHVLVSLYVTREMSVYTSLSKFLNEFDIFGIQFTNRTITWGPSCNTGNVGLYMYVIILTLTFT